VKAVFILDYGFLQLDHYKVKKGKGQANVQ